MTTTGPVLAADLDDAPPSFGYGNEMVVPIDIETIDLKLVFDYEQRETRGQAVIKFYVEEAGYPMFDLVPDATSVKLNGVDLPTADLPEIDDPHSVTKIRVLRSRVDAASHNVLELEYKLRSGDVSYYNDRVRAGFFMSDLTTGGRSFFEQYGPANFEFDHVQYNFDVKVDGVGREHEIYTNGDLTELETNHWTIRFPEYFTTSSVYFHLVEQGRFKVESFDFVGQFGTIPVTIYSDSMSRVRRAVSSTQSIMAELEGTYGPFGHDKLVIYVTSSGGGMEYCGATMTSQWALGHELTHSWFARGVMPAGGNAGWIDEAVASWRDDGYPRASGAPNRSPVNLGGFSPYRRHTTRDAYSLGAKLISELDHMFADQGGMKEVLRRLFEESVHTTITASFFQAFLESVTGSDLAAIFDRYVFGRSLENGFEVVAPERLRAAELSHHPRPYTREELVRFR